MAIKFNRSQTFATNGTVTAAGLHNLVDGLDIYQSLITDQTNLTSVGTADELLIADADLSAGDAPRAVTVQELFDDALTNGTYTNAQLTGNLTYGTATGNRTISTNASITTGTINNATLGTTTGTAATFTNGTLTTGVIPTGTFGTTTSTAATITTGTIPTLTIGSTTATAGTVTALTANTASITNGTVATLNSTTGTITNLSTTLAGDFTISRGTGTLGTTGVTAGTYGTTGVIPSIAVDARGRITSLGTSIGGKVLQVVESTYSTAVQVASTSYTDTGLSASITPTYSSSKILALVQQSSYLFRQSSAQGCALKAVRTIGTSSTDVYSQSTNGVDSNIGGVTTARLISNIFISFIDSPNTTSQCTYKTQGKASLTTSTGYVEFQYESAISRFILFEVAA